MDDGTSGGTEVPVSIEVLSDAEVGRARRLIRQVVDDVDLAYSAQLVATELITNALLHGGGRAHVTVDPTASGVRIEVRDRNRQAPLRAVESSDAMTGRGIDLVAHLAARWGVEPAGDTGKVVWAELDPDHDESFSTGDTAAVAEQWAAEARSPDRVEVSLGPVPTHLLVAAKRHVDNLVREFRLASGGHRSGTTDPVATPLVDLIEDVVDRFEDARLQIKTLATEAARAGAAHTLVELHLHPDAADAAEAYLAALDEVDAYSRANRLLTLESPPQHRVFRRWYIGEIVKQLRAAEAGAARPPVQPFEERLLAEVDTAEAARRSADRAARLYAVAVAVAAASTTEDVATAVITAGVEALGASGGGVLLATGHDRLEVPATVGYDEPIVRRLKDEPVDADLPAAHALRTGEAVWLETVEERNARFPSLEG